MHNKIVRDRDIYPISVYRGRFPDTHNTEHFTEVHYERFNFKRQFSEVLSHHR